MSAGLREVIKQPVKARKPRTKAAAAAALIDPLPARAARLPAEFAVARRLHDLALETLSDGSHASIKRAPDAT